MTREIDVVEVIRNGFPRCQSVLVTYTDGAVERFTKGGEGLFDCEFFRRGSYQSTGDSHESMVRKLIEREQDHIKRIVVTE